MLSDPTLGTDLWRDKAKKVQSNTPALTMHCFSSVYKSQSGVR